MRRLVSKDLGKCVAWETDRLFFRGTDDYLTADEKASTYVVFSFNIILELSLILDFFFWLDPKP